MKVIPSTLFVKCTNTSEALNVQCGDNNGARRPFVMSSSVFSLADMSSRCCCEGGEHSRHCCISHASMEYFAYSAAAHTAITIGPTGRPPPLAPSMGLSSRTNKATRVVERGRHLAPKYIVPVSVHTTERTARAPY